MPSLTLVLPAYNEEARLPRTFQLIQAALDQGDFAPYLVEEILVVNDGSKDGTLKVVQDYAATLPIIRAIDVQPNQGKGNAVYTGLRSAKSDWILIADADSATPWAEFQKLKNAAEKSNSKIAIASRDLPESNVTTHQSWIREHMGKTFNWLVRLITGLPFKDTQCGFKLVHRESIQSILPLLKVSRFSWDVELLLFSKKRKISIIEVPVTWAHQEASRVHAIKDSLEMLFRIIQLRVRSWFVH